MMLHKIVSIFLAIIILIHLIKNLIRNISCNHVLGFCYRGFVRKNDELNQLYLNYQNKDFLSFKYCSKCGLKLDHEYINSYLIKKHEDSLENKRLKRFKN